MTHRRPPLPALALAILLPAAAHAETCRFTGTTSHDGHLQVRAETTRSEGLTTVDVTVAFAIKTWLSDFRYLGQEISTWRGTALQAVAVNQRTLANDAVKRQQWDVFSRHGDRLEAYRVQAKYLSDFRQRYPELRPALVAGELRRALARRLSPGRAGAAARPRPAGRRRCHADPDGVRVLLEPVPAARGHGGDDGAAGLQARSDRRVAGRPGRAPATGGAAGPPRCGTRTSVHPRPRWPPPGCRPTTILLQLGFDIHTTWASGQALLRPEGCQGIQIRPE